MHNISGGEQHTMSKMREPQVIMPTDPTANVTVRCPFPVDIPSRMKKNRLNNSAQNTPRDYPQKRKNTRKLCYHHHHPSVMHRICKCALPPLVRPRSTRTTSTITLLRTYPRRLRCSIRPSAEPTLSEFWREKLGYRANTRLTVGP